MASPILHRFSYYPAIPSPVRVSLQVLPAHDCPYLPGRLSQSRAVLAPDIPGAMYQAFMDAGFRRSGRVVYQPVCGHCRECRPIRVPVATFAPNKSQRRCWRKNQDLRVEIANPRPTDESFALYQRYVREWHKKSDEPASDAREHFEQFLHDSPVPSLEFHYRDSGNTLLAVGICDLTPTALSSVYFYFDPEFAERGMGTYGALWEIDYARRQGLGHYYLGYYIADCRAMRYKSLYKPSETLDSDGVWRSPRL